MKLLASDRFLKSYYKASLGLQNLAEGAVHDLIKRVRSNPKTVNQQYDWIRGVSQTAVTCKNLDRTPCARVNCAWI